mmetsp:Transcript_21741/g.22490  ORF Transcript_21741/g.22490 Transcript_21741/m.22490 type:complete len:257 (+) Transcript_21741:73-843(+)
MGGGASSRAFSQDLKDIEIIKLMVICSEDVYKLEQILTKEQLTLEKYEKESNDTNNNLQYGYYKILQGTYAGQTILSFRGLDSLRGTKQLIDFGSGGDYIRQCINEAVEIAKLLTPNWVCGHTIGGVYAECISSALGISGAAFNTLGPWSPYVNYNILPDLKHQDAKFVVFNTYADPICHLWGDRHIVNSVIWTKHMGEEISEESNRIFGEMKEKLDSSSPPEYVHEVMHSPDGKKLEYLSNIESMRLYILSLTEI